MANGRTAAVPRRSGNRNGESPDAGITASISDRDLLAQFNAHRDELAERAFAALVARHGAMVLRVCCQILGDRDAAEDAFQATFLVLARRSGSIRRPELLGNWLYGVAVRTSCEARMRDQKRREREVLATLRLDERVARDDAQPVRNVISREELEVLHEELLKLPDRYRIPIVLCELEGLSYQEAARRLRCPVGTVGVRLSRGRERLRAQLLRRGIVPAGVLSTAFLGAEGASACLPSALVEATVGAAAGFAVGDAAAAGLASAPVLALASAVLEVMALARLKIATGLLLAVVCTATLPWTIAGRPAASMSTNTNTNTKKNADTNTSTGTTAIATSAPLPARLRVQGAPAPVPAAVFASHRAPAATPPPAAPRRPVDAAELEQKPGVPMTFARREEPAVAREAPAPAPALGRLDPADEQARGALLFAKEWVPDDPMSHGGDGLGPVFNETSCVACHGLGAPGGAGPENKNVVILTARTRGGRLSGALRRIHPGLVSTRSTILHRFGTHATYDAWRRRLYEPEAQGQKKDAKPQAVELRIRQIAARTVQASRVLERPAQLNPTPGVTLDVSERNTPALFGAGLIDAIPAAALVEAAEQQPEEVRGRVSRTSKGQVGRFGWKAQTATLHEFVRAACAGELGLEVPGFAQSASPMAPGAKAKGLDMSDQECDALVSYVRALPAPVVLEPTGARGTNDLESGRELFAEVGCATCHAPTLGEVRGLYSDLLLHDMGSSLMDSGTSYGFEGPIVPDGPSPGEWRTPPLWGFRDSGPYLHDGRARTLDEAVALHDGQGKAAARAYFALSDRDRARVETFLKSLVAPSATAVPGVMTASALEERVEPAADREVEALLRKERAEAATREAERRREETRRRQAAARERRARAQWPLAVSLDRNGKLPGAIDYYRTIARDAPDTPEGKQAAARLVELRTQSGAP